MLQGDWMVIDVRSASEHAAGTLPGSVHLPLEQIESAAPMLRGTVKPIALLCQSGTRAALAHERLARHGVKASVLTGGLAQWRREGLPVSRTTATSWSLERQVRFGAGLLVLTGTIAVAVWGRGWLGLTGFVGAGLTFAGATDICMMGRLMARMPWNRTQSAVEAFAGQ